MAACGRDHESRRRRAPPATNAPCGRHEIPPHLPSSHESASRTSRSSSLSQRPFTKRELDADCSLPSRTWRSVFVLRRTALALSRPAHAGFRERRAAPFRVCAKRPTLCHMAACGRDHESRRRRAPPATNAPCGRREIPASRRVTKSLRPALDLQDALTPSEPWRLWLSTNRHEFHEYEQNSCQFVKIRGQPTGARPHDILHAISQNENSMRNFFPTSIYPEIRANP